jgi:hypothetical protein
MKKCNINFKLNIILLVIVIFISHNYGLAQIKKSISEALNPIYNDFKIGSSLKYYDSIRKKNVSLK